jgi:hypothetical protein
MIEDYIDFKTVTLSMAATIFYLYVSKEVDVIFKKKY